MIEKGVAREEEVVLGFRLAIQVINLNAKGRLCQYYLLILTKLIRHLLSVPKYGRTRVYR